jgi:hypothetical protein
MILFIYLCILALNAVAIFLMYRFLGTNIEKKEKWIFIAVGIAFMYMLVSFVYWLSTKDIDLGTNSNLASNFITFTFVPVNSILILPFLASSYRYWKEGRLKPEKFRNRIILAVIILLIVLVIEFFYFQDIQNGILSLVQANQ